MCICTQLPIRRVNDVPCSNFEAVVKFGANGRLKLERLKKSFYSWLN